MLFFALPLVAALILEPQTAPIAPAACGAAGPPPISSADARPDSISTDRPDLTDSTDIIGARRVQIETGMSFTGDRQDASSEHEFVAPLAMVRVGIGDRFEARLSNDGVVTDWIAVGGTDRRVAGAADLQLGAKWRLFERRCFVLGVEPVLSLPTGSTAFTSGGYDPTVKVIVDRIFPHDISLSVNFVVTSATEQGGGLRTVRRACHLPIPSWHAGADSPSCITRRRSMAPAARGSWMQARHIQLDPGRRWT